MTKVSVAINGPRTFQEGGTRFVYTVCRREFTVGGKARHEAKASRSAKSAGFITAPSATSSGYATSLAIPPSGPARFRDASSATTGRHTV